MFSHFLNVSLSDRKNYYRSWQILVFSPRPVSFIRIVGTHNTANEVFHCVHFECPCDPVVLEHYLEQESSTKQQIESYQPNQQHQQQLAMSSNSVSNMSLSRISTQSSLNTSSSINAVNQAHQASSLGNFPLNQEPTANLNNINGRANTTTTNSSSVVVVDNNTTDLVKSASLNNLVNSNNLSSSTLNSVNTNFDAASSKNVIANLANEEILKQQPSQTMTTTMAAAAAAEAIETNDTENRSESSITSAANELDLNSIQASIMPLNANKQEENET